VNLGKSIKLLRKAKGYTQTEMARQCKLTQTALSQIEANRRRPNSESLKKIALILGVGEPVIYLLATEDTDVPEPKKALGTVIFLNLKQAMLELLTNYPVDIQQKLFK
jgi:transcriptional regulator with XRE-family HTH domain